MSPDSLPAHCCAGFPDNPPMPPDTQMDRPTGDLLRYAGKSIADVERETGLPRATIRIWERRYGFPAPDRDARGERVYPQEQVDRLALMRQLVDQGHRPAKLAAADAAALARLAAEAAASVTAVSARLPRGIDKLLQLLRAHDPQAVRELLAQAVARGGLADFVMRDLPVMNRAVGEAWLEGALQVHEEHLYSDCVYDVLRPAIAALAAAARPEAPKVVLTTFPQEHHGLGLMAAQAVFALQGCPTVHLGVRLPLEQIAAAARAYAADLVALSFTPSMNPSHVLRGLEELRGMLPPQIRIWAGGSAPVLGRRTVAGVRMVTDLSAIADMLAEDFALAPAARLA